MRAIAPLILAIALPIAAFAQQTSNAEGVLLRGIDRYTGEVVDIELPAGQSARFGRLIVTLTECRYPVGNPAGDAYAGLQILEDGRDDVLFSGWMLASSPALNALEHPRYDVWVMRCMTS